MKLQIYRIFATKTTVLLELFVKAHTKKEAVDIGCDVLKAEARSLDMTHLTGREYLEKLFEPHKYRCYLNTKRLDFHTWSLPARKLGRKITKYQSRADKVQCILNQP